MNKVLSQDEIDALLNAMGDKKDGENLEEKEKVYQPYDFKHPDRISKDQLRSLRTIHESYGRTFGTYLSGTLRAMVDINLLSIDQVTYSEYTMSLQDPASIFVIGATNEEEGVSGNVLIELETQFVLFIVDRLLGGVASKLSEPREVTIIEQNVIAKVVQAMIGALNDVWNLVVPLNYSLESFETNPQFVQIAPASETIAIVFFEINVKNHHFPMNVCLPYYLLEPIMHKLTLKGRISLTNKEPSELDVSSMLMRLQSSYVPVAVELGESRVSVDDFMKLGVGDVLVTGQRTTDPLRVLVNEEIKFFGAPGELGNRRAVRLTRKIEKEDRYIFSE